MFRSRRSLSFPRLSISKLSEGSTMPVLDPYQSTPAHSRHSSDASSTSSPIASTFSTRSHSRFPSSSSSLVTNPDSPAVAPAPKATLDDLLEHPSERDESSFEDLRDMQDEPLCICDSPFCQHRQSRVAQTEPATPDEWTSGDDYFSTSDLSREREDKRRRSAHVSGDGFTSRLSRHFSSFSRRGPSHRLSASVSGTDLRTAPPSRATSQKRSSQRSTALSSSNDVRNTVVSPTYSTFPVESHERSSSPPMTRSKSRSTSRPVAIAIPLPEGNAEEERDQLASTPLLPPMMSEYFNDSNEAVQSPLQSPTVAPPSIAASVATTPAGTPALHAHQTPPLPTRMSQTSLHNASRSVPVPPPEIPPLVIAEETDPWAFQLGHANFHITPEPYIPPVCDARTCKRLADDWESARREYMRVAARTSEHYGVTSQTYKLTQAKWEEIDAQWRSNHQFANAEAHTTYFQPLGETEAPMTKMPSLNDPKRPFKFPEIDEKDIVGPMVRYAKVQQAQSRKQHSRKPSFLRVFTNPASLLGRSRSASSSFGLSR